MDIKEIRNGYFIRIGCSVKDAYTFFEQNDYDFFAPIEERNIKVYEYEIPLNKYWLNCRKMHIFCNKAVGKFKNQVKIVGKGTTYDVLMDGLSEFYGDFIKFIMDKFPIDEKILQHFMIVTDRFLDKTSRTILNLIQEYDKEYAEASVKASENRLRWDMEAMAKASKVTTTLHKDFTGSYYTHTTSGVDLKKELRINDMVATSEEADFQARAYNNLKDGVEAIKDDFTWDYRKKIVEVLEMYFPDVIGVKMFLGGSNVQEYPILSKNYKRLIPYIREDEIGKVKEALRFFDFELKLEDEVKQNIIQHFKQNHTCDYSGMDYKFLEKNLDDDAQINQAICDYISKEMKRAGYGNLSYRYTEELEMIEACKYLTAEQKSDFVQEIKSSKQANTVAKIFLALGGIVAVGVIAFVIGYFLL